MKQEVVEDSVFLPEGTTNTKTPEEEMANGEYGLVINGHSLVRPEHLHTFWSKA